MASNVIRQAKPSDAEALCCLNRNFNGFDTADADHIRRCLTVVGPEICLVSETDGSLTGYVCGVCFTSLCYRDPIGQITELYVDPLHRRNGVGEALIRTMIDHLKQLGTAEISLLTGCDNMSARSLYEKCGFKHEDERFYLLATE